MLPQVDFLKIRAPRSSEKEDFDADASVFGNALRAGLAALPGAVDQKPTLTASTTVALASGLKT